MFLHKIVKKNTFGFPILFGIAIGLIAAGIKCTLVFFAMMHSASSTAGAKLFFLPQYSANAFLKYGLLGIIVGIVIRGIYLKKFRSTLLFITSTIVTLFFFLLISFNGIALGLTYIKVHQISETNNPDLLSKELLSTQNKSLNQKYNVFIIAAIANNPYTSPMTLDQIAHLTNPHLNERLIHLINLSPNNPHGHSILRLIAENPSVSLMTLTTLFNLNNEDILGAIAGQKNASVNLLRQLYKKEKQNQNSIVLSNLASNTNTPPDILRALAKQAHPLVMYDPITSALITNPSTPHDVVKQLKQKIP